MTYQLFPSLEHSVYNYYLGTVMDKHVDIYPDFLNEYPGIIKIV